MRSIGARLAVWYAVASMVTMIGLFGLIRFQLEMQLIHGIDLLIEDEFGQIKTHLGPDYMTLSSQQIQDRLRGTAVTDSTLFYFQIHAQGRGTLFSSSNLRGRAIPDVPGEHLFNAKLPGEPYEMRVGEYVIGPTDIMIATSKKPVKMVLDSYWRIYAGMAAIALLISAATGFFLSRLALRPVRLIQETANHIGSENLAERIPVSNVRDEISELALLLNRMFDRLESSFKQIRRFTAEASHELKTPLSLVRLQAEKLLVDGGLSPSQEESVQVQLEEITRLNQIIEELLFISRAEARAITLATRREDPRPFLRSFFQDARVLVEHRGVRFAERVSGQGLVDFDPKWIRQVLLNLLANALNVSPRGTLIQLISETDGGVWRVAIEDEGPGVPPEQRERIFERFVRLTPQDGEVQEKGSGLGLAISRSIVGLHRGHIRAEAATRGTGLRVVFEIPLATGPERQPDSPPRERKADLTAI